MLASRGLVYGAAAFAASRRVGRSSFVSRNDHLRMGVTLKEVPPGSQTFGDVP
jgi:hypothetical protein